ncbi:MAG: HAD family hydrolase [Oscillospiraceae bacterium]
MKYTGIFFDFDYTLGDATDAIIAGYHNAFSNMGLEDPTVDAVRHTVGHMLADGYSMITGDRSEENRQRFCALFAEVARPMQRKHTKLCVGAKEVLHGLHEKGIAIAVISSKHEGVLQAIMDQHDLTPILADVVGGDKVKKPKPDPEGILKTLAETGLAKEQVLFCGDTVIDAEAAKNAGVDFCAVLNGTTEAPAFADFPCVHIAPDLPELQRWLGV